MWWVYDGLRSYPFDSLTEAMDFKNMWNADKIELVF
jgi:hypothetical protein